MNVDYKKLARLILVAHTHADALSVGLDNADPNLTERRADYVREILRARLSSEELAAYQDIIDETSKTEVIFDDGKRVFEAMVDAGFLPPSAIEWERITQPKTPENFGGVLN